MACKPKTPPLNMTAVRALSESVKTPMVLHGSSGVSDEDLHTVATQSGICKINMATRLRKVFIKEMAAVSPRFKGGDHIQLLMTVAKKVTEEAVKVIRCLNADNTI